MNFQLLKIEYPLYQSVDSGLFYKKINNKLKENEKLIIKKVDKLI